MELEGPLHSESFTHLTMSHASSFWRFTMNRFKLLILLFIMTMVTITACKTTNDPKFQHLPVATTESQETATTAEPEALRKVTFVDSAFEAYLEQLLQVEEGSILVSDLRKLYTLNIDNNIAYDLSGLEYAVNLKKVTITNSTIKSLAPLAKLKYLPSLKIINSTIEEVPSQVDWANILTFSATDSQLPNIDFLKDVTTLDFFIYTSGGLSSLDSIQKNNHLKTLDISNNAITDLSVLSEMTLLTSLNISKNKIANLDVLAKLTNLNKLDISYTLAKDLTPIMKLKKLNLLTAWDSEDQSQWIFDRTQLKALESKAIRVEYFGK